MGLNCGSGKGAVLFQVSNADGTSECERGRARGSSGKKWRMVQKGRVRRRRRREPIIGLGKVRALFFSRSSPSGGAEDDRPREGRRGASQNCRCSSVSSLVPQRRVQRRRREPRRRSHLDGGGGSAIVVQPPYKRGPGRLAAAAAKLKFSRLSLFCGSENYTSRQDATRRHSCWSNKIGGCSGKAPWQSLWENSKPPTPVQSYDQGLVL